MHPGKQPTEHDPVRIQHVDESSQADPYPPPVLVKGGEHPPVALLGVSQERLECYGSIGASPAASAAE
jgi:hypothetical protein